MKNKGLKISLVALLALGIALVVWLSQDNHKEISSKENRPTLMIKGYVADSLTLWETITRNGRLMAQEEADLAFESSGKIIELNLKEGSTVKKGDLLGRLNDEVLLAQLATYQAQMPLAKKKLSRQRTLVEQDAASVESLEELETELDRLEASIKLVEAQIKQTHLLAPFDGVIGLRNVSVGDFVSTATSIVKITQNKPLKVEFTIPDQYVSSIKQVKSILFTTVNHPEPQHATIYAFESKMNESNTLTVRALYDNSDLRYHPGEFASIKLELNRQHGTIAIPNEAMTATSNGSSVFLFKNGKIQTRMVQTGIRTDTLLQITKGLALGDTIAVTGLLQLHDGMSVLVNLDK